MTNEHNPIKEITIVGGGSAGWMAAAALSRMLNPQHVSVTLVESEDIGTVGVGEATIPDIIKFNQMLGISEAEFIAATSGTFKLGIEFNDWGALGDSYFHPFGGHGVDMNGIDFHQYWLHTQGGQNKYPLEDYSICAVAARQAKFVLPDNNPRSVLSHLRYAYHFDASSYARFLRGYAEKRGVKRVEGKVKQVQQDKVSGNITGVLMENDALVTGQLFFDCTGFRSLLLGDTLGVKYKDWSHWLPCNSAQAVGSESTTPLIPYTKSTAKKAGWQWRIPTQARTGNGHIYSTEYMDDDEANSVLLEGLDSKPLGEARTIRFTPGSRESFWEKNCVGIGLSSGFLEPLESTSIYLIQQGISRFIALYPDASMPEASRKQYNQVVKNEFEQVRDFIILHYKATQRNDSPFWNYCRNMDIPDTLQHRFDLFSEAARVFRFESELFSKDSWIAVFVGQNISPERCDTIVSSIPRKDVQYSLDSMRGAMQKAVTQLPDHRHFIEQYIAQSKTKAAMS
jgi:tryptophan halogenase